MMHWIPASLRKPKSGEHVIVLQDGYDRTRCHAVSAGWFDAIEDWLGPDGEVVVGVTHWTELEEPPPVEHLVYDPCDECEHRGTGAIGVCAVCRIDSMRMWERFRRDADELGLTAKRCWQCSNCRRCPAVTGCSAELACGQFTPVSLVTPEPASPPDPTCSPSDISGASEGILAAANGIENETECAQPMPCTIEGSTTVDAKFRDAVAATAATLSLSDMELSRLLMISCTTATRWRTGASAPAHGMRAMVYLRLIRALTNG